MRTIEMTDDYQVIELTTDELLPILMTVKRGTFSYFEIHTIPSMNKRGNPYYNQVTKITKGNILVGGDYQTRVRNNTGDVDFVPERNNVGSKVDDSCVQHNENLDRYYLQYEWFEKVLPKSYYEFNGNPIEKQVIQDYMRKRSFNKYGVNVQSVKVENIKEIHLDHTHYKVVNPE